VQIILHLQRYCRHQRSTASLQDRVPCVHTYTMHAVVSPAFSLTRSLLHWLTLDASSRACRCRCNNHALQLRHFDKSSIGGTHCTHVSFTADKLSRGHRKRRSFDTNMWPAIGTDEPSIPEPLLVCVEVLPRVIMFVNLCYRLACSKQCNV
jgi:hypothetical protein